MSRNQAVNNTKEKKSGIFMFLQALSGFGETNTASISNAEKEAQEIERASNIDYIRTREGTIGKANIPLDEKGLEGIKASVNEKEAQEKASKVANKEKNGQEKQIGE